MGYSTKETAGTGSPSWLPPSMRVIRPEIPAYIDAKKADTTYEETIMRYACCWEVEKNGGICAHISNLPTPPPSTEKVGEWEKEVKSWFELPPYHDPNTHANYPTKLISVNAELWSERIISLTKSLLQETRHDERKKLREKIERMKKLPELEPRDIYESGELVGYHQALKDLLTKL